MVELTAHVRKVVGKRANSALRRESKVPAVLYGRGREPQHLFVYQKELVKIIRAHHESGIVNLTIVDGEQSTQQQALYKEVKPDNYRRRVNHLDFQAIRAGEKINMKVAV
ncbi:MAG: 50S ribosomal protein L25, partial [Candidatus Riflebacteria bacterium]|nr:50S ribosomal protein L25 [Candidatus Riflebacteria bacterium]